MAPSASDPTRSLELVRRAQGGDAEAMDRLVARYYERVRPMVRARLGPRLRARLDSADVLQETFADAVRMFDRFEVHEESSLVQWLSRIAELRVRDAVQKARAAKRDLDREVGFEPAASSGSQAPPEPTASSPSPSAVAAGREERERFERCLDRLGEDHREVLLLRAYAGASWEEVARAMGRPSAGAARMLHSRAMAELASLYRRSG